MKLSKQSLINALILATEKTSSLVFAGAQTALQDGTLEIEGYVREDHFANVSKMGCSKFDPNDPRTFPQEAGYYIVAVRDWHKRDRVSVFYYDPDDPRESWWAHKVVCYKRLEMPPEEMFPPIPMPPITPWWSDAKHIRAKMKREREKAAREANFTLCSPKK